MTSDSKSPVFTFRYLKDKEYYSRKTIVVSLVDVGFPRSRVLWDFISGYDIAYETEVFTESFCKDLFMDWLHPTPQEFVMFELEYNYKWLFASDLKEQ